MNLSLRISSLPIRPDFLRLAVALVSTVATLAAGDSVPPATPKVAVPVVSSDEAVQKELAELDRRLDSNPKLTEILSENLDRLTQESFRKSNPAIDVLLKQQPGIIPALKVERHFLIHRYVVRRARGPVLRTEILALDKFLTAHPDIRQELDKAPSQIVDGNFLMAHPSLGEFFGQNPGLSTVLLEKQALQPGARKR